jgi:hypothetical protein
VPGRNVKHYGATTWLNPKIEVRSSAIEGLGLFAKEDIHEGESIVVMGGQVLTDEEFKSLELTKYSAARHRPGSTHSAGHAKSSRVR